ncbi:MAG: hypothetical protein LUD72_00990 [Bacteroidales bacterium]|nr:hypothetical protein [Bacteroidales bacterium]
MQRFLCYLKFFVSFCLIIVAAGVLIVLVKTAPALLIVGVIVGAIVVCHSSDFWGDDWDSHYPHYGD